MISGTPSDPRHQISSAMKGTAHSRAVVLGAEKAHAKMDTDLYTIFLSLSLSRPLPLLFLCVTRDRGQEGEHEPIFRVPVPSGPVRERGGVANRVDVVVED